MFNFCFDSNSSCMRETDNFLQSTMSTFQRVYEQTSISSKCTFWANLSIFTSLEHKKCTESTKMSVFLSFKEIFDNLVD
jgi:hypothetical protein